MKRARQGRLDDDRLDGRNVFVRRPCSGGADKLPSVINTSSRELQDPTDGYYKGLATANNPPNKQMHLAGSTLSGARIATRSKARQIEENNHVVSLSAAAAAFPADAAQHAPALVAVSSDLHQLKPTAISSNQQAGSAHQGTFLPAATKRTVKAAAAAAAATSAAVSPAAAPTSRIPRLQQLPSDDLQHILDAAAAAPSSSRLVHPSLLRNAGIGTHALVQPQQESPVRGGTASATSFPALKQHASIGATGSSSRSNHLTSSKLAASGYATRLAAAAPAVGGGAAAASQQTGSSRVTFAPGPLSRATARTMISEDGHPATEGALAVHVRRLPQPYPMDLTRGNVLMLENLLGSECAQSVTRLKRRVGLLPPIRPPRPHVCSRPAGRAAPFEGEEEAAAAFAALPAAALDRGRDDAHYDAGRQVNLRAAAAAVQRPKLPGKARAVLGRIESRT